MLYLKFALNIEKLADEMISKIKQAWTNPLVAPIVIFPDPKLEYWFRLHWVKTQGTLANFNSMMIDRFLMTILCPNDNTKKKLNADLLRSVIWAYLYKNYKSLGDEVTRYLEVEGKLDEKHLFDLCSKMATLFLEYETSRPKGFVHKGSNLNEKGDLAEGILDRWKQGNLQNFFDGSEREVWQRKLYSQIFHTQGSEPSILTKAFENYNQRINKGKKITFETTYLTIPFLFQDCMLNHGKFHTEQFSINEKTLPVFVFGLTGMGQFYRVILQEYAKTHDVNAYIQNPCMEFWEDTTVAKKSRHRQWNARNGVWQGENGAIPSTVRQKLHYSLNESADVEVNDDYEEGVNSRNENALLSYWGKSGRDNIKLWCQANDYNFEFEEESLELPSDSLLHQIQYMVASRTNELPGLLSEDNESFSLTAAPTREREIEALHTRICKLLAERDKDGNPVNRISDILVVSPNLDVYRTAIFQCFDQQSFQIPFSIVDSPAKKSLTGEALSALFAMQEKRTLSRSIFFDLVRNPVIQQTRQISNEDVSAWESWVENMNVFRTRGNGKNDWTFGLKRLMASRFSDHKISAASDDTSEGYSPYMDINSENDASLSRFADCVTELEEWIEYARNKETVELGELDLISTMLNKWLAMTNPPDGMNGETIIFQNVLNSLEDLKFQFDAGATEVSWDCISQTLISAAEASEYSCGSLFMNGITFAKFVPNRIIPIKHLFFIGLDSGTFPGSKSQNTLDLRRSVAPWPGDDSPVAKQRYAFLCQLMSVKKSLHISYLNKNIVKDEDLYPSSVVADIRNFLKNALRKNGIDVNAKKVWPQEVIPLDESRDYGELFTQKEFRNKSIFEDMKKSGDESDVEKEPLALSKELPPDRVSFYQFKKYLEDPFQFRVSQVLNDGEEDDDPTDEDFEPIVFDILDKSSLMKQMVKFKITGDHEALEKLKWQMLSIGDIPDGVYGEKMWQDAEKYAENIIKLMEIDENSPKSNSTDWTFDERIELPMEQLDGTKWTLQGSLGWCNKKRNCLLYLTTSDPHAAKTSPYFDKGKYLSSYVAALAIIASETSKYDDERHIEIQIYSGAPSAKKPAKANVVLSPNKAKEILKKLYQKAFCKKYSKAVPADIVDETIETFSDYTKKFTGDHNLWKYFKKAKNFDTRKDLGFSPNNFEEEWEKATKQQRNLMCFSIDGEENTK